MKTDTAPASGTAPASTDAPATQGTTPASAADRNAQLTDAERNTPALNPIHAASAQLRQATEGQEGESEAGETDTGELTPNDVKWNKKAHRNQDPETGKFVKGKSPADRPDASAAAAGDTAVVDDPEGQAPEGDDATTEDTDDTDEPKANVVQLRGRDGTSMHEIDVGDDTELAEMLRANANDGLRRDYYNKVLGEVRQREGEIDARQREIRLAEDAVAENPVAFLIDNVKPETRVAVARALLAEHFDDLLPDLERFADDRAARMQVQMETRDARDNARRSLESRSVAETRAAETTRAIRALIPDTVDAETAAAFYRDAVRDVREFVTALDQQAHARFGPADVPKVLERRLRLYGIGAPPNGATKPQNGNGTATNGATNNTTNGTPASAREPGVARPVGEKAQQLVERARSTAVRRTTTAKQRSAAAASAPPGAGAAPARKPVIPQGATIEEASKAMRKLGNSWTSAPT